MKATLLIRNGRIRLPPSLRHYCDATGTYVYLTDYYSPTDVTA